MNTVLTSKKLERQLSSVRHSKVKRLKSRIATGKYKINNLALARALFLTH